jgi:hypothetical protein
MYRAAIGQGCLPTLASNRQQAASSHTSHGDHGEAEAGSEPPPADEPPLLTSGAFDIPLYGPFFSATSVRPLRLFCFARIAGAVSPHRRKRTAAGVALCLSRKIAKGIGRFYAYVTYSPVRRLHARLAL